MRKVLVIGSSGAGKSVFSRRLGEITKLPVLHLDRHFWHPGWVETPKDVWRTKVEELLSRDNWIIDGNYGGTMELRLERADTVIFLDYPRRVCTWGVIKRVFQYRGDNRPDLADECPERFDWSFVKWTWNYPRRSRPTVIERLDRVRDRVKIIALPNRRSADEFLKSLKARNAA